MQAESPLGKYGWHAIPETALTILGHDASIRLIAKAALCHEMSVHAPDAISFDVTIELSNAPYQPIRHAGSHGFYGSLRQFQEDLKQLKAGQIAEAKIHLEGVEIAFGTKRGNEMLVSGCISNVREQGFWPWPTNKTNLWKYLQPHSSPATNLRFAFRSSIIDPPRLDTLIREVGLLLDQLK